MSAADSPAQPQKNSTGQIWPVANSTGYPSAQRKLTTRQSANPQKPIRRNYPRGDQNASLCQQYACQLRANFTPLEREGICTPDTPLEET